MSPLVALTGTLPPLSTHQLLAVTYDPLPVSLLAAALVLYLLGVARANRLHPRHRWPARRTAAFVGGIVATAVAILSVIGVYDDVLFADHMVQHLLLIMVAGWLFAASSPIALAWRASTGRPHRALSAAIRSRAAHVVGHPVAAFALYALTIPLTHLTVFMTLVLETSAVHHLEHIFFVVVGFLFWRQIAGSDPHGVRLHPALKALYMFLAVPVDTFVGLTLSLEKREIFPVEATFHRTWGPSLVASIHWGGVIMWVGGDMLMMLAFVPIVIQWVRLEDRSAVRADREALAALPSDLVLRPEGQPTAGFALGTHHRSKAAPGAREQPQTGSRASP